MYIGVFILPVQCTDPMVVALLCLVFNNGALIQYGVVSKTSNKNLTINLPISSTRNVCNPVVSSTTYPFSVHDWFKTSFRIQNHTTTASNIYYSWICFC